MFLDKQYILANELVQKMGIHIANISQLRKYYLSQNEHEIIIKRNVCSFISSNHSLLPANIKRGIAKNTFTNMSDKLPCTWVATEYKLNEKELIKGELITDRIDVAGKPFYVFEQDFVEMMKGKLAYTMKETEAMRMLESGEVQGAAYVGNRKYLVWY